MKILQAKTILSCSAIVLSLAACADEGADSGSEEQRATSTTLSAEPKEGGQVEIYASEADGQFYFRLEAKNGENLLRSEGYTSLAGAENGAKSLKDNGRRSTAYDIRKASNGEYYFNVIAGNGEVIGTSETYTRKSDAKRGAETTMGYLLGPTSLDYWVDQCGFQLYTGADDQIWFRLVADNGEKLLKGEGYTSEAGAKTGIDTVVTTTIVSQQDDSSLPAFRVFQGADDQYYWHLKAGNGEIVASGGEGFSSAAAAEASIELVKDHAYEEAGCWTRNEPTLLSIGDLSPADCCEASNNAAACSAEPVTSCVCEADAYCCDNAWDDICVKEVDELGCGVCN